MNNYWKQDYKLKAARLYLSEMTATALKYDIIIAEPIASAKTTYKLELGCKLYWDCDSMNYVMMMPDGSILTAD